MYILYIDLTNPHNHPMRQKLFKKIKIKKSSVVHEKFKTQGIIQISRTPEKRKIRALALMVQILTPF